jgi:hypothetical protein
MSAVRRTGHFSAGGIFNAGEGCTIDAPATLIVARPADFPATIQEEPGYRLAGVDPNSVFVGL